MHASGSSSNSFHCQARQGKAPHHVLKACCALCPAVDVVCRPHVDLPSQPLPESSSLGVLATRPHIPGGVVQIDASIGCRGACGWGSEWGCEQLFVLTQFSGVELHQLASVCVHARMRADCVYCCKDVGVRVGSKKFVATVQHMCVGQFGGVCDWMPGQHPDSVTSVTLGELWCFPSMCE